jgi:ABC-type proline/glycine betaine transport system permease subunit
MQRFVQGFAAMNLPVAALAMMPGVESQLFTSAALAQLADHVELVDLGTAGISGASDEQLRHIEVLIGSWGCPKLDDAMLSRLPALRLLSYAQGRSKRR